MTTSITTHAAIITPEIAKNLPLFPIKLICFLSFSTPKYFTSSTPNAYIALRIIFVITRDVNIERIIPIASVVANPFTVPEPLIYKTTAAIRVVTLPSIIAERALSKPSFILACTDLPFLSSSLIRVNIITLASTAIPILSIIPATPGSVRVILSKFNATSITTR